MKLIIENAVLWGDNVDLHIEEGRIRSITSRKAGSESVPPRQEAENARILDAGGNFVVPSLKNGHTHAAMTLLRGYADDMKLQPWLEEKIWPAEASLTAEDLYWGTRLAAIEMIRTGTTFSNDMYFYFPEAWKAYKDSGIKAAAGPAMLDFFDEDTSDRLIEENSTLFAEYTPGEGSIPTDPEHSTEEKLLFSLAPHSIYTVSEKTLRWTAEFAREKGIQVHIHLSETEKEVNDCIYSHGVRPVEYLHKIGLLGPHTLCAHGVWLSEKEVSLLADSGTTVAHNPASNMKLASGSCFPYRRLKEAGVPIMLGTDGCSSNNNLNMFDEMKLAALLQKHHFGDTELMTAGEILDIACGASSDVYPHLSGKVEEGAHADLLLIDRNHPSMVPSFNLDSNLVYSCAGTAVDSVICAGEVLMEKRKIEGEEEVLEAARERARLLKERAGKSA
ncbi:MAG: amidohydrolase [Spirochaetia bacterium]